MPNRLERTRILCEYKPIASSAGATNRQKNSNSRATRPSSFIDVPSTPWSLHRSRPPSTRSPRVRSSPDRSTGSSRLEDARPRSLFPGQRPVVARAAVAAASTHLSRPANRASTSRPSCANQPIDRNNYFPSVVPVVKSTARARVAMRQSRIHPFVRCPLKQSDKEFPFAFTERPSSSRSRWRETTARARLKRDEITSTASFARASSRVASYLHRRRRLTFARSHRIRFPRPKMAKIDGAYIEGSFVVINGFW